MSKRIRGRVLVDRRVEYRYPTGVGDGMLINLSLHGCRIKGASSFSCGTRLRLQLWLSDQAQPIQIEHAVVRWVKDDQFGVSFLEVPADVRACIEQVFQVLHAAQQPEVHLISVSEFLGSSGSQKAVSGAQHS
jgi:hypothetical protein